jgi:hypothetical protein
MTCQVSSATSYLAFAGAPTQRGESRENIVNKEAQVTCSSVCGTTACKKKKEGAGTLFAESSVSPLWQSCLARGQLLRPTDQYHQSWENKHHPPYVAALFWPPWRGNEHTRLLCARQCTQKATSYATRELRVMIGRVGLPILRAWGIVAPPSPECGSFILRYIQPQFFEAVHEVIRAPPQ